jgi:colanic acid biosynthesis protein WcaH
MFLESEEYERIITVFPRVCVDILLTDTDGRVLLLQRTNQPAIGQWWFPGGRVHIGETRLQTAHRKLREECGLLAGELSELGSFDLFFEIGQITYHDVTILFQMQVESGTEIAIDAEASSYGWFAPVQCQELNLHPYVIDNIRVHARLASRNLSLVS